MESGLRSGQAKMAMKHQAPRKRSSTRGSLAARILLVATVLAACTPAYDGTASPNGRNESAKRAANGGREAGDSKAGPEAAADVGPPGPRAPTDLFHKELGDPSAQAVIYLH